MNDSLLMMLAIAAAYLAGSIPFGWLIARVVRGIDIRTVGSGNIGATNVSRTVGKSWGILVLFLDAAKGWLPTFLFPLWAASAGESRLVHLRVACGAAAIFGHMFPCWLGFKGGKGVATALGVISVVAPVPTVVALLAFAGTLAVSRIVSLSSMVSAICFGAASLWQLWPSPFAANHWSQGVFCLAIPLLILVRHRSNLRRILRGQEPRLGEPIRLPPDASPQTPADAA